MSSWETQTTISGHDAAASLNAHVAGRNRDQSLTSMLEMVKNKSLDLNVTTYDMVGIVGSKVQPMRESIQDYVYSVQKVLENAIADAEAGMNDAFRGVDAQREVKAYLEKVKTYVNNLITQLLSFSDKLADVGNAWQKAQAAFGSSINSATGSFSEGTAYVENITYTESAK